jgi:hypothetical protein
VAVVALALSGCGSDPADEADGSATTAASPTTSEPPTSGAPTTTEATTTTEGRADSPYPIVGTWTADAGQILAANTANLGGTPGLGCEGEIVMTFTAEGTFTRTGEVVCGGQNPMVNATGSFSTSGEWYHDADTGQLVTDVSSTDGQILFPNMDEDDAATFSDPWSAGAADYQVVDGVLEVTFTDASVGTVTQKYVQA